MMPRIQRVYPRPGFQLEVVVSDGYRVIYDTKEDLLEDGFDFLFIAPGLFEQVHIDEDGISVYWNDDACIFADDIRRDGVHIPSSREMNSIRLKESTADACN